MICSPLPRPGKDYALHVAPAHQSASRPGTRSSPPGCGRRGRTGGARAHRARRRLGGPAARAEHGGLPDAARQLECNAPARYAGSDVSSAVDRHRADRVPKRRLARGLGGVRRRRRLEAPDQVLVPFVLARGAFCRGKECASGRGPVGWLRLSALHERRATATAAPMGGIPRTGHQRRGVHHGQALCLRPGSGALAAEHAVHVRAPATPGAHAAMSLGPHPAPP